jgi:23S rRNA (cytosine1962-C5)-methyltransferase
VTRVHLRPGHVQPLWAGHPWVYAQAIARVDGTPEPGDVVEVADPKGILLGRGFWSPKSAIPVRILTRHPDETPDDAWLQERIGEAKAWRQRWLGLPSHETDGYRLVHSEGDGLGGLICDVYGSVAVVQLLTFGMKRRAETIARAIIATAGVETVLEVPSPSSQAREGFETTQQVLRGRQPEALRFRERGFAFDIDLGTLQKTGAYFDQRDNRARVEHLAQDARVLDAYCYMGGFGLAAARGGAREVLAIDRSPAALAAGGRAAQHARLSPKIAFTRGDVRKLLMSFKQERQRFDVVVLDPPKLSRTIRDLDRARKAYRHLNALAMGVVTPGGLLVSCSCSAAMKTEDFLRLLGLAGRDVQRNVTWLEVGDQAADHPTPAVFAEGRYLKCAFVRIT